MKKKKKTILLAICLIAGFILLRQQYAIYKLKVEYRKYNEQLSKLKYINSQLNEDLKETKREDYIEKMARDKLGLIKPGEILFKAKQK